MRMRRISWTMMSKKSLNLLRNGANAFECQYALGCSSVEMTLRYYQALTFEDVFKNMKYLRW